MIFDEDDMLPSFSEIIVDRTPSCQTFLAKGFLSAGGSNGAVRNISPAAVCKSATTKKRPTGHTNCHGANKTVVQ